MAWRKVRGLIRRPTPLLVETRSTMSLTQRSARRRLLVLERHVGLGETPSVFPEWNFPILFSFAVPDEKLAASGAEAGEN
jgi:hypothetical protein